MAGKGKDGCRHSPLASLGTQALTVPGRVAHAGSELGFDHVQAGMKRILSRPTLKS